MSVCVNILDSAARALPPPRGQLASTSVFAHVEATLASAGIGLLPNCMAATNPLLHRVLPEFEHPASYWAVLRDDVRCSHPVQLLLAEIREHAALVARNSALG